MVKIEERLVTDKSGRVTDVILSRRNYERLMQLLHDFEDRLEIKRRKRNAMFVPWEKAKADLKRNGKL